VFPESEWTSRKTKARELIEKNDLDGLLIFSDSAQCVGNVCYLTNYHQALSWASSMLIFPKEGDLKLVATIAPRDTTHKQKALPFFVEIIPAGLKLTSNEHISSSAIDYMRENGMLDGKRWGTVNMVRMPKAATEPWLEIYPGGLLDFTDEFGFIRAIKSESELYALSSGSSIARTAVLDYLRMAKPGENEMVIAADIDRLARLRGCEDVSLLTYSGKEDETMLRVPWDRSFEDGDTVSAFMSVSFLRYFGVYGATTVIGGRSEQQDALFAGAESIFEKKVVEMQAGSVITGYVQGQCDECGAKYSFVINGVGMNLSDYPDAQGVKSDVHENMTFTVSLFANKAGVGSVFMSRNVLVTSAGIFPLSGFGK